MPEIGVLSRLLLYFHTLRYLKPAQILGRLVFRLSRRNPDQRPPPTLRPASGTWIPCSRKISMSGASTFRFLSVTRELSVAGDWNRTDLPKLWLYNLHYFDDLNADGAPARAAWHQALIARWIAENPPAAGNGWEPYPVSLRIVNWVKWALAGNVLETGGVHSLAVQARWLMGRLEWHLLGNHLLANAKALVFAGTFFAGTEADAWRERGLEILRRQHAEQILHDGGHFERSPMYHAIILEDLLDLIQLALCWPSVVDAALVTKWRLQAGLMLHWLAAMTHPNGEIALFNDAAMGIAPNSAALAAYGAALGLDAPAALQAPLTRLAESGYVRMQKGDAMLIADVGEIGPDYLPGHAHADTLSFELSVFGQRLVVNSGTSEYGLGAERLRQRSTAAHSTVQIDGVDSSEVWSGFRVARRARPVGLAVSEDGDAVVEVACAHDGYRRLQGRPLHRRTWRMTAQGLRVSDAIDGDFGEAVARYHFHPAVVVSSEAGGGLLHLPDGHIMRWSITGGTARIVPSTWHPEFGQSIASACIELLFSAPQATMEFFWD
ncbi:MAG: heparinase II/III family protein [Gallionella sp.]|jgi:uncharacterized heparinase superfamily protein|nr:heparinase II/III family protein [Gallionella sp.]